MLILLFVVLAKLSQLHSDIRNIKRRYDEIYTNINNFFNHTPNIKVPHDIVKQSDLSRMKDDLKAEMRKLIARKDDGRLGVIREEDINIPNDFFEYDNKSITDFKNRTSGGGSNTYV